MFRKEGVTQILVKDLGYMLMRGTRGICCFIGKTTIRTVGPWLTHGGGGEGTRKYRFFIKALKRFTSAQIQAKVVVSQCLFIRPEEDKREQKREKGSCWIKGRIS